jgi:hypothetical protein
VCRIIYLGGLGETGSDLSEHLASRREVEAALASGGIKAPCSLLRRPHHQLHSAETIKRARRPHSGGSMCSVFNLHVPDKLLHDSRGCRQFVIDANLAMVQQSSVLSG